MNSIKLLALDIDGTTMRNNNTLSAKVRQSIEKAIANGIIVVVASGRPYGTMPKQLLDIEGIDYVIASNGSAVYDKSRKCIRRFLLDENEVVKLLGIIEPYDLILEAFIDGLTYTDKRYSDDPIKYGCHEDYVDYVRSAHGHIEDMKSFILEHKAELDSIEIIEHNPAVLKMLWDKIENNTDKFYITSSTPDFIEFMDKKAGKASALQWLCNELKIDKSSVADCGNADNDADMIEWAGLGTAVENAVKSCKQHAQLVVPSNENDGVAALIEKIFSPTYKF